MHMRRRIGPFIRTKQSAFTLVELVAVLVLISIVAVIGSGFIIQAIDSYQISASRNKLVQQGRLATERITRELRMAIPNSIRVSGNNLCIEWLPTVAGANYLDELPDQSNGAAGTATIDTAPLDTGFGTARYVSVGALSSGELYGVAPSSLERFSSLDDSSIPNVITLASSKIFQRNSVNRRVFIADHPQQICVSGGNLTIHEGYTSAGNYPSSGGLTGTPPNAGTLLADGVIPAGELPFAIQNGTQTRNTIVNLELPFESSFEGNGERIVLEHRIMVRNVP